MMCAVPHLLLDHFTVLVTIHSFLGNCQNFLTSDRESLCFKVLLEGNQVSTFHLYMCCIWEPHLAVEVVGLTLHVLQLESSSLSRSL